MEAIVLKIIEITFLNKKISFKKKYLSSDDVTGVQVPELSTPFYETQKMCHFIMNICEDQLYVEKWWSRPLNIFSFIILLFMISKLAPPKKT